MHVKYLELYVKDIKTKISSTHTEVADQIYLGTLRKASENTPAIAFIIFHTLYVKVRVIATNNLSVSI